MSVLSVAHTGVRHAVGRARYEPLSDRPELDLTLLAPSRWSEYGSRFECEPAVGRLQLATSRPRLVSCGPLKWYLHFYPGLGRLLRQMQPDVLHLWEEPWSLVALQACVLRARYSPRTALIFESDQNILRRLPPPFEWIRRATLAQADLMIARQAAAEAVLRSCGFVGPVRKVAYGVDQSLFRPAIEARQPTLVGRPLRIGYVGRMIADKGIFELLEAVGAAASRIDLVMVGLGADLPRFAARVLHLGLGARVNLMGDQPLSAIADIMRGLDALVLFSKTTPTWKEQFGRVIIEAQACGVPVIGSSSGAIPEVVGDGGWIIPEGDAPALAVLFDHLDRNRPELCAKSEAALGNVASRYTYEHVAEALLDAYSAARSLRVGSVRLPTPRPQSSCDHVSSR